MEIEKWQNKTINKNKIAEILDNLDFALIIIKSKRKENIRKIRYKDYLVKFNNRLNINAGIFKEFDESWSDARLKFKVGFNAYDPSWKTVFDYLEELENDCLSVFEVCIIYSNNSTSNKITYKNI